jgi:hypothetical protein
MMILFPTILNDESGLTETSVVAWTISYDIGYMSSSTSRTLERWKAINLAADPFIDNQMADLENKATQYESPNEGSGNAWGLDL